MNQGETTELLTFLSELWPNWPLPSDERLLDVRIRAWQAVLGDVTVAEAMTAVRNLAREARPFAPSVGEVYQAIVANRVQVFGDEIPDAADGWAELKQAVRSVGAYGHPQFSHIVIDHAVRALGYEDFCMSATDDEPSWRAQYLRFHGTYADRYRRDHHNLEALPFRDREELE